MWLPPPVYYAAGVFPPNRGVAPLDQDQYPPEKPHSFQIFAFLTLIGSYKLLTLVSGNIRFDQKSKILTLYDSNFNPSSSGPFRYFMQLMQDKLCRAIKAPVYGSRRIMMIE
jgi:hypothetical protein